MEYRDLPKKRSSEEKGSALRGLLGCLTVMTVMVVSGMALIFGGVGLIHFAVECWKWWGK